MDIRDVTAPAERITMQLCALYAQYGYRKFKLRKFEEYDFYAEYRSFLQTENILIFHDLSGKLMALKPDVTLSIVKNIRDDSPAPQRVYYNENVYRASGGVRAFKEMPQVGLEYIGAVDLYAMGEVLQMAARSLKLIAADYILDISHVGLASGLLGETGLPEHALSGLSACIRAKNVHGMLELCGSYGVEKALQQKLVRLCSLYGACGEVLPALPELDVNAATHAAIAELTAVCEVLRLAGCAGNVRLDFSMLNDLSYYNGVIFQGFLPGIPSAVLSGGRYDSLLERLHKRGGAIGFAVYIGLLERVEEAPAPYDVDTLLLYDETVPLSALLEAVNTLTEGGRSISVQSAQDGGLRPAQTLRITKEGGVCRAGLA
ncbi:MAG: ATP phosphoribosyltransferase regulatory subunit [Christensenellaceae bacterium]|nr:ATP phosphoribosyltransferase regulatory subunit [Christensenellaceae bacterium]